MYLKYSLVIAIREPVLDAATDDEPAVITGSETTIEAAALCERPQEQEGDTRLTDYDCLSTFEDF